MVKIPETLKTFRFYVATSEKTAYSSWPSLTKARESYKRLSMIYQKSAKQVIGIIEVNGIQTRIHPVEESCPHPNSKNT